MTNDYPDAPQPDMAANTSDIRSKITLFKRVGIALVVLTVCIAIGIGLWRGNVFKSGVLSADTVALADVSRENSHDLEAVNILKRRLLRAEVNISALDARLRRIEDNTGQGMDEGERDSVPESNDIAPEEGGDASPYEDEKSIEQQRRIDALQLFVNQLAGELDREQNQRKAAVVFVDLRLKADAGESFKAELLALRRLALSETQLRDSVAGLDALGGDAVPTAENLRSRWVDIRHNVLQRKINDSTAENADWQGKLKSFLGSIIVVRRANQANLLGDPVIDALDKDLRENDWAQAVLKIDAMPDNVRELITDLRRDIVRRRDLNAAFSTITAALIADIKKSERTDAYENKRDKPL